MVYPIFISKMLSLTILSIGVLAPTRVLEGVQARRIRYGYGLEYAAPPGVALVAVEDCKLLGYEGLAIVEDIGTVPIYVVDCEQLAHKGQLRERGLIADISNPGLAHQRAMFILWRE